MKKDSKTDGEIMKQPAMEKVCYFLFKNGGQTGSVKFGKEFSLEPDFSLSYMDILAELNKYPVVVDNKEKTISLSPDGERIYRIADLIVDGFRDDLSKLADAVMRFMICGTLSCKDRKQKKWSIDDYAAYCLNTIGVFLGDEEKPMFIETFSEKWSVLNSIYQFVSPNGWDKFMKEKNKKSK